MSKQYLDFRVVEVSNGYIVTLPRTREDMEDMVKRPDQTNVFPTLESMFDWIRVQAAKESPQFIKQGSRVGSLS